MSDSESKFQSAPDANEAQEHEAVNDPVNASSDAVADAANDAVTASDDGVMKLSEAMEELAAPTLVAAAAPAAAAPTGPGQVLSATRQGMGLTVEQVATQLNLAPRQILSLEADDFAALPGMASVRGFVRSYAKLLKLDAEPLIAMIAHMGGTPLVEPLSMRRALSAPFFDDSRMPAMGLQGPQNKPNLLLLIVIVAVVLVLFGGYQLGLLQMPNLVAEKPAPETVAVPTVALPAAPVPDAATAQAEASAAAPEASAPAAEAVTPAAVADAAKPDAPKPEAPKQEAPKVETKPEAVKPAAVPAAAPAAAAAAAVVKAPEPVLPANKGALVIKFSEDTWIELRKANVSGADGVIASRMARANTTESFDMFGDMSLTIGNAAGVASATLRGSAVDIKGQAKNNVARLTLK